MNKQGRFRVYRDRKGEWRWRLIARNGRIVADSGEGYDRRNKAMHAAFTTARIAHGAYVDVR